MTNCTSMRRVSGSSASTKFMTPAIASEPYCAEAPSRSTSSCFTAMPARHDVHRLGALVDSGDELADHAAAVAALAVDEHQRAEATTLTVETTGRTDTYGTLFDGDETSLETNDDGGSGLNYRIERAVQAGTYFVEVRGFGSSTTGSYELSTSGGGG